MRDDLLAQADRAIRESQLLRDQARKNRNNARTAVARAQARLLLARMEGDQSVAVYEETILTQTASHRYR
jgi:hypothetical protein